MNIALIPAKLNSKRILKKNIKKFCGKPLIYWICKAVQESKQLNFGIVSTESDKIKDIVNSFGFDKIKVINEDVPDNPDMATHKHVIQNLLCKIDFGFKNFVYLNPTSPFMTASQIDFALHNFEITKKDSQLCVIRQQRFQWFDYGYPKNYNIFQRPRTQDFTGELIEVGSCYISTYNNLIKYNDILGGRIGLLELPEYFYFELDTPLDWIVMTSINKKLRILQ
jgi:CMP-N-acetylneuraminic acid synthetase